MSFPRLSQGFPPDFFSPELCANYLPTVKAAGSFVLFDGCAQPVF
jgi:hypothetical protein